VSYMDLVDGISLAETVDDATGISSKSVLDWRSQSKNTELKPRITLWDEKGNVIKKADDNEARYYLVPDSILSVKDGHRIVEIGCIELDNLIPTSKKFHCYLNPERKVSEKALEVHGYTDEFLSSQKKFSEICDEFLDFIKDKKLIIHNAPFDLAFLNYEMKLVKKEEIDKKNVIDTLEMARAKYPGSQNSLDALCKRFNIDNSRREKHSALIDCNLLKEVYVNLLDQKAPKLNLESGGIIDSKYNFNTGKNNGILRKIIKLRDDELKLHKKYLQSQLPKNNYNWLFFLSLYIFSKLIFFSILISFIPACLNK